MTLVRVNSNNASGIHQSQNRCDNNLNAAVSKLKKVLVKFSKTDIILETLADAQAAGINVEPDLTYCAANCTVKGSLVETWSPSFGPSPDDGNVVSIFY